MKSSFGLLLIFFIMEVVVGCVLVFVMVNLQCLNMFLSGQ